MTTSIEWTDATWNPTRGCTLVSAGCTNCYAMKQAHRFSGPGQPYEGLTRLRAKNGPTWTGALRFVPERLDEPLRWRKPRRVFVNSMSDLFHEGVSDEQIAAVFGVMAAAPQHVFQILTKRPERAARWFEWAHRFGELRSDVLRRCRQQARWHGVDVERLPIDVHANGVDWPLSHVWLGVSVEDQATADERIPILLDTPAVVRWVSQEPQIGEVVYRDGWLGAGRCPTHDFAGGFCVGECPDRVRGLSWIVIGGESGPGARPFDLAWARSTIEACRDAGVPAFCKQLGARPHDGERRSIVDRHGVAAPWLTPERAEELAHEYLDGRVEPAWLRLSDRKGGDPSEWPEDLRVREWPR